MSNAKPEHGYVQNFYDSRNDRRIVVPPQASSSTAMFDTQAGGDNCNPVENRYAYFGHSKPRTPIALHSFKRTFPRQILLRVNHSVMQIKFDGVTNWWRTRGLANVLRFSGIREGM